MKKGKRGFTLSESFIAIAIVGVLAALYIPSIVADARQREYKTAFKKALNVVNNAISLNMVLEGDSPNFNANLFGYLQRHMFIYKSTTALSFANRNYAFYTADGLRYEFPTKTEDLSPNLKLHETEEPIVWNNFGLPKRDGGKSTPDYFGHCGSRGMPLAPENMKDYPCIIMVDVNGDRKPNPQIVEDNAVTYNDYIYAKPEEKLLKDVFTIMVTENKAVPFGVVAQKAMYERDEKKRN